MKSVVVRDYTTQRTHGVVQMDRVHRETGVGVPIVVERLSFVRFFRTT